MDTEASSTNYLTLKEFLARNSCVKPRTFTRWKKRRLIDFIQPGGPNTTIFVPADALERMQERQLSGTESSDIITEDQGGAHKPKAVRKPNWQKQIKPNTKENDA